MRCCSRSARRCGPKGSRVLYFAGYKTHGRPLQGRGDRGAADVIVWCCDEAPGFTPRPAAGSRLCRQHRRGDGGLRRRRARAESRSRSARSTASSPSAPTDDGGGRARRGTACSRRYLKPGHHAIALDQFADAMHDEGDLRPVPAAPSRSRHRQETVVFSCFNQDQRWTGSTSPRCAAACRRTACRKS